MLVLVKYWRTAGGRYSHCSIRPLSAAVQRYSHRAGLLPITDVVRIKLRLGEAESCRQSPQRHKQIDNFDRDSPFTGRV